MTSSADEELIQEIGESINQTQSSIQNLRKLKRQGTANSQRSTSRNALTSPPVLLALTAVLAAFVAGIVKLSNYTRPQGYSSGL
ncbi:MAG: hypothetical protein EZS28_028716 [Streblomastix strix]|uniref:Uncharacterized protein n=1 Tax=Streblomastix strix TaxID=222440 RepID=A0A5J4V142_9EUKA|nr:MAG: hypothetical protein EZS28_028716 [Streblomastix strix]